MNITKDFQDYVGIVKNITPRFNFRCEKYTPIDKCSKLLRQIFEVERNIEAISSMSKKSSPFNDTHLKFSNISGTIKKQLMNIEAELKAIRSKDVATLICSDYEKKTNFNILDHLNSKVGNLTMKFKKFLQGQTEIIRKVEQRRSNLTTAKVKNDSSLNEYMYSSLSTKDDEDDNKDVNISIGTQLKTEKNVYYQDRLTAVQAIEKTMNDLSGMMNRLGQMTYEQRFMIEKIDNNTDVALKNVEAGYKEVEGIYRDVRSNRWLLIKIFLIIIVTAVIYILLFT